MPQINDITVNFSVYIIPWAFPFSTNPLGTAPLTVYTTNTSVNANSYEWTVRESPAFSGMTVGGGMTNPVLEFEKVDLGVFEEELPFTEKDDAHYAQMTIRDIYCIVNKVPLSNKKWLNNLIDEGKKWQK